MTRYVDLSFARIVAIKRIVTGSLSLASGIGLIGAVAYRGAVPALAWVALALLFGGGAWTLRDGVRLYREVRNRAASRGTSQR